MDNKTKRINKLIEYGFVNENGNLVYKKDINDELEVVLTVSDDVEEFSADVIDKKLNEQYAPYYLKGQKSGYVANIIEQVDELIKEVIDTCFDSINVEKELIDYCMTKYETTIVTPWNKWPSYKTIKNQKGKWYGLFIDCDDKKFGMKNSTGKRVYFLNLKLDPNEIKTLIDNKHYFPAYHQNKKNWMSVLLNENTDLDKTKELIDKSYSLVLTK